MTFELYFVHFSVCLSDGCRECLHQTVHKFLKNVLNDTDVTRKNLFHNLFFRMKRGSTASILSQNNKTCNGTNESVKIVISLHCVTPFFSRRMQTTDDR